MKRLFIGSLIAFGLAAGLSAQQPQFNTTQYRAAFAFESLTVSNVSKILTASVYAPTTTDTPGINTRADYALVSVENTTTTDCMRFRPDGVAPTTTVGHKICDGGSFYIYGFDNIANLRMIRITSDVTIQVSYYRFASNTN